MAGATRGHIAQNSVTSLFKLKESDSSEDMQDAAKSQKSLEANILQCYLIKQTILDFCKSATENKKKEIII